MMKSWRFIKKIFKNRNKNFLQLQLNLNLSKLKEIIAEAEAEALELAIILSSNGTNIVDDPTSKTQYTHTVKRKNNQLHYFGSSEL